MQGGALHCTGEPHVGCDASCPSRCEEGTSKGRRGTTSAETVWLAAGSSQPLLSALPPCQVVMFTSEEPTRFGLSCSGSRAMAGARAGAGAALPRRQGTAAAAAAAAAAAGFGLCCRAKHAFRRAGRTSAFNLHLTPAYPRGCPQACWTPTTWTAGATQTAPPIWTRQPRVRKGNRLVRASVLLGIGTAKFSACMPASTAPPAWTRQPRVRERGLWSVGHRLISSGDAVLPLCMLASRSPRLQRLPPVCFTCACLQPATARRRTVRCWPARGAPPLTWPPSSNCTSSRRASCNYSVYLSTAACRWCAPSCFPRGLRLLRGSCRGGLFCTPHCMSYPALLLSCRAPCWRRRGCRSAW